MDNEGLIAAIYEAGALPAQWPEVLERIGARVGAKGGNLIRGSVSGIHVLSSPSIAEVTADFARLGFNRDNTRVSRCLARASHPGFLTDCDLHSIEEIRSLPMYTEFLTPRGVDAGAGTVVQGAEDDALIIAIEGFHNHSTARQAVAFLDGLRPHLARAALLGSRVQATRTETLIEAFNTAGTAIALLNADGRVLGASEQFATAFDDLLLDGGNRLLAVDGTADRQLETAFVRMRWNDSSSASIAVRDRDQFGCAVLHLLPARRQARDLFSNVRIFALLGRPDNHMLPDADIISALFDLTSAEARVARGIAQGKSVNDLALQFNVSIETVRTQLKRIFAKTSTTRQGELISLLTRLGGTV
ncbi:DNA-binding transcriptional regulator, CsgD family [Sphingobium faniae]|nr:DNA-binding transcriptional regulator, CsgD family [Sphingobium faniae]